MSYSVCNISYDNELNQKLNKRYFPSQELQPNFDFRPESTKYTHFSTSNNSKQSNEELRPYKKYNTHKVFYTGNDKAPTSFYFDNVDVESTLRSQFFALQRNDKSNYIPSINSDLYNHNSTLTNVPKNLETNRLQFLINTNMDPCNLAPNTFNNSTRHNVKNIR